MPHGHLKRCRRRDSIHKMRNISCLQDDKDTAGAGEDAQEAAIEAERQKFAERQRLYDAQVRPGSCCHPLQRSLMLSLVDRALHARAPPLAQSAVNEAGYCQRCPWHHSTACRRAGIDRSIQRYCTPQVRSKRAWTTAPLKSPEPSSSKRRAVEAATNDQAAVEGALLQCNCAPCICLARSCAPSRTVFQCL